MLFFLLCLHQGTYQQQTELELSQENPFHVKVISGYDFVSHYSEKQTPNQSIQMENQNKNQPCPGYWLYSILAFRHSQRQ